MDQNRHLLTRSPPRLPLIFNSNLGSIPKSKNIFKRLGYCLLDSLAFNAIENCLMDYFRRSEVPHHMTGVRIHIVLVTLPFLIKLRAVRPAHVHATEPELKPPDRS